MEKSDRGRRADSGAVWLIRVSFARTSLERLEARFPGAIVSLAVLLVLTVATQIIYGGWNDGSRLAQVQAIVEFHELNIDKSDFLNRTGDKYFYRGHFYSDKPPILSLYISLFYFLIRFVGLDFSGYGVPTYYILTFLSVGLLATAGAYAFRSILLVFGCPPRFSDLITFCMFSGTLVLPFSTLINNHVPSAMLIMFGTYSLCVSRRAENASAAFCCGLAYSLAASIDVACLVFLPFIFIASALQSVKKGIVFSVATVGPLAAHFYLNYIMTGGIKPASMTPSLWTYEGSTFSADNLSGVAGQESLAGGLAYAFHMLVGHRGLISHSPVLILGVAGWLFWFCAPKKFEYRREVACILAGVLSFIIVYILKSNNYSGWSFGVRWFATICPVLMLGYGALSGVLRRGALIRRSFVGLALLSIVFSGVGAAAPFPSRAPWQHEEPTNGLVSSGNAVVGSARRIAEILFIRHSDPEPLYRLVLPSLTLARFTATLAINLCLFFFFYRRWITAADPSPVSDQVDEVGSSAKFAGVSTFNRSAINQQYGGGPLLSRGWAD